MRALPDRATSPPAQAQPLWRPATSTATEVIKAIRGGGVWATSAVTGAEGEEGLAPGTDGSIIAYSSTRAGETDIFYEPVAGGNEQRLALAGLDRNPNVSDGLISFERQASAGASRDVYLYDTVADR